MWKQKDKGHWKRYTDNMTNMKGNINQGKTNENKEIHLWGNHNFKKYCIWTLRVRNGNQKWSKISELDFPTNENGKSIPYVSTLKDGAADFPVRSRINFTIYIVIYILLPCRFVLSWQIFMACASHIVFPTQKYFKHNAQFTKILSFIVYSLDTSIHLTQIFSFLTWGNAYIHTLCFQTVNRM